MIDNSVRLAKFPILYGEVLAWTEQRYSETAMMKNPHSNIPLISQCARPSTSLDVR